MKIFTLSYGLFFLVLCFGIIWSLLGGLDGVSTARRGGAIKAIDRISWNTAQSMVMAAVTMMVIDAILFQLFGVYAFNSLVITSQSVPMDTYHIIISIGSMLLFCITWMLFFMKVYETFIKWKCPKVRFEKITLN